MFVNQQNEVIATGYNGTPDILDSCFDSPCPDADKPAGSGPCICFGIHAEERALMNCNKDEIHKVYCTKAPCMNCVLKLLNTTCQEIYFLTASNETINQELWEKAGRKWEIIKC